MKIIILGDLEAGKTKLVEGFKGNIFNKEYKPTVSVETDYLFINSHDTFDSSDSESLAIYDLSGTFGVRGGIANFEFDLYMQDSKAAIIAIDLSPKAKPINEQLELWSKKIDNYCHQQKVNPIIILVGTKSDLDKDGIKSAELQTYAEKNQCNYAITSAKDSSEVEDTFKNTKQLLSNENVQTVEAYQACAKAYKYFNNNQKEAEMYYKIGEAYHKSSDKIEKASAVNFMSVSALKGYTPALEWLKENEPGSHTKIMSRTTKNDNSDVEKTEKNSAIEGAKFK